MSKLSDLKYPVDEYLKNRIAQAIDIESKVQQRKWSFLVSYREHMYLSSEDKIDFIRDSLASFKISDTTLDIMVRKMIRMTLPGWVTFEFLSRPDLHDQSIVPVHKVNHSVTCPGLSYTTTLSGCDCPGNRSHKHCKHHDAFLDEQHVPSVEIETVKDEEVDFRASVGIGNADPENLLHVKVVDL